MHRGSKCMEKCKICLDIWIAEKRREDVEFTSAPTKLFFIICLHDFNGDLYTIRLPGQAVTILTCAVEKHLKQGLNLTQWPSLEKIHDCPFIPKLAAPFWVGEKIQYIYNKALITVSRIDLLSSPSAAFNKNLLPGTQHFACCSLPQHF